MLPGYTVQMVGNTDDPTGCNNHKVGNADCLQDHTDCIVGNDDRLLGYTDYMVGILMGCRLYQLYVGQC